jgi:hypothetical protein
MAKKCLLGYAAHLDGTVSKNRIVLLQTNDGSSSPFAHSFIDRQQLLQSA